MRFAIVAVVLAVGCTRGPEGPEGPEGPVGPPVLGLFVWKDATGAVVSKSALMYQDAGGVLWGLDAESAAPLAPEVSDVSFISSDCTGEGYVVSPPLPLRAFRITGESAYRVRPAALAARPVNLGSTRSWSGCSIGQTVGSLAIPLSGTAPATPIQPPALPFAAPLHQEMM